MNCRVAVGLFSVLLVVGAAAIQTSATPRPPGADQSPSPEARNATCQSQAARLKLPFDPCRYAPEENRTWHLRPLSAPDPVYSEAARKRKIQGTTVLAVAINESGSVDAIKVVRSVGHGLDEAAMDAVKQWKFVPTDKNGNPIAVQTIVEVSFRLY